MANLVLIGYTTDIRISDEQLLALTPNFEAPSNYKDKDKIEAYQEAQRKAFQANAKDSPYTGKISSVRYAFPAMNDAGLLSATPKSPKASSKTVAERFASVVQGWTSASDEGELPHFVGFGVRKFIKMLGVECALAGKPLNPFLWGDSRLHTDIERWLVPDKFNLKLETALQAYGFIKVNEGWEHSSLEATWKGPGVDPSLDVLVLSFFCAKLGLLTPGAKLKAPVSADED